MWNIFSFEYVCKAGLLKVYYDKQLAEAAVCWFSTKNVFLKTLHKIQENNYVGVSFLILHLFFRKGLR